MTAKFVPPREPLVNPKTGLITRTWYLFFQGLFSGFGMSDDQLALIEPAASALEAEIRELIRQAVHDASLEPVYIAPLPLSDDLSPPPVTLFYRADDVLPMIGSLRDEVATLRRDIEDLRMGTVL